VGIVANGPSTDCSLLLSHSGFAFFEFYGILSPETTVQARQKQTMAVVSQPKGKL
jgi:hypothetical protein